jgi:hypothetical protein
MLEPPRKPCGKIAELPETLRTEINRILNDGSTYKRIADRMSAAHRLDPNTINMRPQPYSGL